MPFVNQSEPKLTGTAFLQHYSPVSLPRAMRPDSRMENQWSRIAQIWCHQFSHYIMRQFTFDICQAFIPQTYKQLIQITILFKLLSSSMGWTYYVHRDISANSNIYFSELFTFLCNFLSSIVGKNILIVLLCPLGPWRKNSSSANSNIYSLQTLFLLGGKNIV